MCLLDLTIINYNLNEIQESFMDHLVMANDRLITLFIETERHTVDIFILMHNNNNHIIIISYSFKVLLENYFQLNGHDICGFSSFCHLSTTLILYRCVSSNSRKSKVKLKDRNKLRQ